MKHLTIYPNCSKGGVTSVLLGRARQSPDDQFDCIFFNDRGGRTAFEALENIAIRIVPKNQVIQAIKYAQNIIGYDEINILSAPEVANKLGDEGIEVNYEFHSPNRAMLEYELRVLKKDHVKKIYAPSQYYADFLRLLCPAEHQHKIEAKRNILDSRFFSPEGEDRWVADDSTSPIISLGNRIPLVVIGRFEVPKGFHEVLRLLAETDSRYFAVFLTSLEQDVDRFREFYLLATRLNVLDRIVVLRNLNGDLVSSIMRETRNAGGFLLSCAEFESFGYAVGEAIACRLPVLAYDLAVWREFKDGYLRLFDPGDFNAIAKYLQQYIGVD